MDLEKSQLEFLITLSKMDKIHRDVILDSQLEMVKFLEDNKLVEVNREIIRTYLEPKTHTFRNEYGDVLSVSISQFGKAYLAGRKNEFKHILLKDVFIPIIVTLITNLLIFGIQWLLPLIQGLLTNTPK